MRYPARNDRKSAKGRGKKLASFGTQGKSGGGNP